MCPMSSTKLLGKLPVCLLSLAVASLLAAGCGSGSTASTATGPAGASFVMGTDAPMASVTSFAVQLTSVNAIDAKGDTVSLISGTPTVDFARFNGLQTMLDMNDVPAGTYTNIQITLGSATLGYLNTVSGSAPTIVTEPATLTSSTVNITLASPLVVTQSGSPVGINLDFNLRKSILVDGNGNITGAVTPTFTVGSVAIGDAGAYIDEFDSAVVSVNTTAQSFVVQGPHGQFTVNVTGNTEWENSESISSLTTSSIVAVSGVLGQADATIDADEVAILSQNGFYATGQVTYVTPATGTATNFNLYLRGLLPTTTSLVLGQIATVDVSSNTNYFIYRAHNTLSQFLFNDANMLAGQAVALGGTASAVSGSTVTPTRVVLRHWGFNGTFVASSINASAGQLPDDDQRFCRAAGSADRDRLHLRHHNLPQRLHRAANVTGNVRVVGLLVKGLSGNTVLIARYVDVLN